MMDVSAWYLLERILMLSSMVALAAFAIYQWRSASVRLTLSTKFREEAEAATRKEMAAELAAHYEVLEKYKRRIKNAQLWLAARQQEGKEIVQPIYNDLFTIRSECLKIRGASRDLLEACSLINKLSRHKTFMESISKSQRARLQTVARDAKAEIKAVELEALELKARVDKAEQKLKSTEWFREEPPIVHKQEPENDTVDKLDCSDVVGHDSDIPAPRAEEAEEGAFSL